MFTLGFGRPLLSISLRNRHGVLKSMPATRKKTIAVTNSWALLLPSNHEHPGSTAISTVNNHTWHQHNKLTIIKLNAVPKRHLAPSKLMEAKIWVVVTMPTHDYPFLFEWPAVAAALDFLIRLANKESILSSA